MNRWVLVVGDILSLAAVTLIGFGSHGELATGFLPRMAAALLPLCAAWFLLAPALGLFDPGDRPLLTSLWRPAFVMLFAGPLAAVLRGLLLQAPVMPSFAIVLSATGALAVTIWRGVYQLVVRSSLGRARG